MTVISRFSCVFLLAALSGCAGMPRPAESPVAVVVDESTRQREQARVQLARMPVEWGFAGRVAVTQGKEGGSGRLDWQQDGRGFSVRLSAPVTRQGWELTVDAVNHVSRLEGVSGGTRVGQDPRELVARTTGWDLPVMALGDWVRGLVGDGATSLQTDASGRPLSAQQDGWDVRFVQWHDAAAGRPALPRRIDAVNGLSQVRLIVDEWSGWE